MEVKINVAKESYELGQGVAALVGDVKRQLADGWQPVLDTMAIAKDVFADLIPAFEGVEKIKAEMEDKVVFAQTAALIGAAVLGELLK